MEAAPRLPMISLPLKVSTAPAAFGESVKKVSNPILSRTSNKNAI